MAITLSRDDISFDGNVARRLFWEKCASRQPQFIFDAMEGKVVDRELSVDVAEWADRMLDEWDKRWIADDNETTANEVLP